MNANHPTAVQLRDFGLGRLNDAAMDTVSNHVAVCDTCCQMLAQVHDDTLIELCRAAGGDTEVGGVTDLSDDSWQEAQAALEAAFENHPRYRLRSPLGHGGMGLVYKAEHKLMDRLVAIKVIHPGLTANAKAIDRFQREIRAAGKLNHANIVAALDAEQNGLFHCLIMEFARGVSLDRIVRHRGVLHPAGACRIIQQAAFGLQHAFEREMVHRDIKPQNLLATMDGQVKILDFGLARFASEHLGGSELTGDGMLGTPEYMAPEQIERANEADIRSDIYSLGCTLFFLLTGQSPFRSSSHTEVLMGHLQADPPSLRQLRPDAPARLERIVTKMLAKDPSQRFQTPHEVAEAMSGFIRSGPADEQTPQTDLQWQAPQVDVPQAAASEQAPVVLMTSPIAEDAAHAAAIDADGLHHLEEFEDYGSTPDLMSIETPEAGARVLHSKSSMPNQSWMFGGAIGAAALLLCSLLFVATRGCGEGGAGVGGNRVGGGGAAETGELPVLVYLPQRYWRPDFALFAEFDKRGIAWKRTGPESTVADTNGANPVVIDTPLRDVQPKDYRGIVVIGGDTKKDNNPRIRTLLQAMNANPQSQFVAGICAGQWILGDADVIGDRTISRSGDYTAIPNEQSLRHDQRAANVIVTSDNLITATSENEVDELAAAIAEWLEAR